jgi:hypothetical protein
MPSSLKRRLADLNEYNVDFGRFAADERQVPSASLMPRDCSSMAMSDASALATIDRQFIRADSLAGYMQRRSDRLFNTFGIAAFTMGIAYLIYDKVTESKILLLFYMVILLLSLLVYYFFQTKRWFSKYLSYRSLAETLRVRFYLALAGLDRRMHTRELISLTGIYRFPGFGWISFALDSIEPTAARGGAVGRRLCAAVAYRRAGLGRRSVSLLRAQGRDHGAAPLLDRAVEAGRIHHRPDRADGDVHVQRGAASRRHAYRFAAEEPADAVQWHAGGGAWRVGTAAEQDGGAGTALAVPQPAEPVPAGATAASAHHHSRQAR